ncbi:ribosome biogenesis GTPase Der [Pontibacter sp. BT310]|uniref:GTPase Der n=1 Tax=Pontibacter populi TaxID=890055 RepID=A0ABS6XFG9_9BACT|nr:MULTISPECIES: ribosome biogenesis GTPase Der [Pontibacter]MBJ6119879.1 ribosome biogenesis GTPase Der [Pontibacter sp. BT310]MBR0572308.1 ribosome biogenesis GTPase Der [Microvirga sp. STS03]MBW3366732.1 ribosome biogenesis GTPase Der [Pontibacter populi]
MSTNIIAIVGRPNVGKSTLFNRLVGRRQAIMDNESGVTRDRSYGHGEWCGKFFTVIDTGGYVHGSDDIFEGEINKQVELAIKEADVILFMVDVDAGMTGLDEEFASVLRRSDKPIYVVANKADTNARAHQVGEFYSLGIDGEIFAISSQSGSGTGDLLDEVVKHFKDEGIEDPTAGIPKIAVLGRPNVGKSSFVNLLLGTERNIVTDIAGTTRDAIHSHYNAFGKEFIIVDTAGLRRKSKVSEDIEFYSVMRSVRALEDADVCIVMLDATRGIEAQDVNIITLAEKNRKGIVILVNKWDLVEKDTNSTKEFEEEILDKIAPIKYVPVIFTSVLTKQRIHKAIEVAMEVYDNKTQKIPTSKLNDALLPDIERYPPPAIKGKFIRIKYVTQLPTHNPTFAFFCNLPQYIKEAYTRYLENRIREHFGFKGVPIKVLFKKK